MITRHTGSDIEGLAALVAAARGCPIDGMPGAERDELIDATDARISCQEVMLELLGRGCEWDSCPAAGRLTWHPADGVIATLDAFLDILSVSPEQSHGRIVSMAIDTTTMTAREVFCTAVKAAEMIGGIEA